MVDAPNPADPLKPSVEVPKKEEIELIFNNFIKAWNQTDYQKQVDYISQDFQSSSYNREESRPYSNYKYGEYQRLKRTLSSQHTLDKAGSLMNRTASKAVVLAGSALSLPNVTSA